MTNAAGLGNLGRLMSDHKIDNTYIDNDAHNAVQEGALGPKFQATYGTGAQHMPSHQKPSTSPANCFPMTAYVKAYVKLAEFKRGSGLTQSFGASAFQTRLSRMES